MGEGTGTHKDGRGSALPAIASPLLVVAIVLAMGLLAHGFWIMVGRIGVETLSPWAGSPGLGAPTGLLAAAPLMANVPRNLWQAAMAVLVALFVTIQALAGMATAVLLLGHWHPDIPAGGLYGLLSFLAGALVALPTIVGGNRWLTRRSESQDRSA